MGEEAVTIETHPALKWLTDQQVASFPPENLNSHQLVRWLQGDDGSTAGDSVEPHVWILQSLEDASSPGRVREQLARHCRVLLEQRPDRMLADGTATIFRRPGPYVRNLLCLCSQ